MLEKQGIDHKWIVNLDSPFNKREAALNNLKTFDYDYHDHDIHISDKACFYSAAKHVITSAYDDLVDLDGYVMWLRMTGIYLFHSICDN